MTRRYAASASSTTSLCPLDQRLLQRKVALLLELHRQQIEIEELRGRRIFTDPWDEKKSAPSEPMQSMLALQDTEGRYRAIFEHPTILIIVLHAVRTDEGASR